MIDPRASVVGKRLEGVRSILAVASGKGGVGKSTCATIGALALARGGMTVGLLDLDLQGASCHTILGCQPGLPAEDRGLKPLVQPWGPRFVSIASFTGERPVAMRGSDLSSAVLELLAVTVWGTLDVLLIDMPPGIHDPALELSRLVPQCEHLLVTTRSRVALSVSARFLRHLMESGGRVAGVVENMATGSDPAVANDSVVARLARREGVPFLGTLHYDPSLEEALGNHELLVKSPLAAALQSALIRAVPCAERPRVQSI